MSDKIYCVFCYSDLDDGDVLEVNDNYFTNKEAAETYAKLCKLKDYWCDYRIVEMKCCDHMLEDYKIFIRNLEEEKRLKEEAEKIWAKRRDVREYAKLKAKLERGNALDYLDIEKELLKEYGLED